MQLQMWRLKAKGLSVGADVNKGCNLMVILLVGVDANKGGSSRVGTIIKTPAQGEGLLFHVWHSTFDVSRFTFHVS